MVNSVKNKTIEINRLMNLLITLLYIILAYILLSVIGFITIFIIKSYESFNDDKTDNFSIIYIINYIYQTKQIYILLPCYGIIVTLSTLIIISLFINIHKYIKNMDWDTIV